MRITIGCTAQEQREARIIEAFVKGLVSDANVQRIDRKPAKEETT